MTTTYDLRISAAHREYLLTAMLNMCNHPTCLGADQSEREEIHALKDMLVDAVSNDAEPTCNDFTL